MKGWSVFRECENLGDRKLTGLAISEHYCACPATKQLPPTLILPLPICITATAHSQATTYWQRIWPCSLAKGGRREA